MDFFAEKNHFSSSTLNNVKKEEDLHDGGAAQLRGMLSQVSNNYNALQMDFVSIIEEKMEEKKHDLGGGGGLIDDRRNRRTFAILTGRSDPGGTIGSPQNNAEVVLKEYPVGQSIIGNGNKIVPFDQDKSSDQVDDGRGAAGKWEESPDRPSTSASPTSSTPTAAANPSPSPTSLPASLSPSSSTPTASAASCATLHQGGKRNHPPPRQRGAAGSAVRPHSPRRRVSRHRLQQEHRPGTPLDHRRGHDGGVRITTSRMASALAGPPRSRTSGEQPLGLLGGEIGEEQDSLHRRHEGTIYKLQ
ncbi:hypothetical protein H6P81_013589 [Aristolochia fimbriata]|uniref:Uncharacterized protein n=1 Tax=Aristolochia fimbriata TaxID=158543 RepID=A0AAV7EHZ5_ARIFI|nr:hypothetical protein H6P81_013589 [Aristolochia fimbriata]